MRLRRCAAVTHTRASARPSPAYGKFSGVVDAHYHPICYVATHGGDLESIPGWADVPTFLREACRGDTGHVVLPVDEALARIMANKAARAQAKRDEKVSAGIGDAGGAWARSARLDRSARSSVRAAWRRGAGSECSAHAAPAPPAPRRAGRARR